MLKAKQMHAENFYDGKWRPVTDLPPAATGKLHMLGFEFGSDPEGRLAARWPIDPPPVAKPALTFTGIPLAYWREEARRGCAVALARLARIVEERGADYELTIAGLRD